MGHVTSGKPDSTKRADSSDAGRLEIENILGVIALVGYDADVPHVG